MFEPPAEVAFENAGATRRRKAVEDKILSVIQTMDKSGTNAELYRTQFSQMDDSAFQKWMEELRDKKRKLVLYTPNMKVTLQVEDLIAAAKMVNVPIFERLRIWDPVGQRTYTTPHSYLVLRLPVRRLKQFLFDKISIPESDKRINAFTGQVARPDKSSSVSAIELQTIASKGLDKSIVELATVRGGNPDAYADFKASLEETGQAQLSELDPSMRVRSAEVASVYLTAMGIENNL